MGHLVGMLLCFGGDGGADFISHYVRKFSSDLNTSFCLARFTLLCLIFSSLVSCKVAADTGKIKAYREALADGGSKYPEIKQLRDDVNSFARTFPVIGFDQETMRYPAP